MAFLTGSLTFISASITGSSNIKVDFAGLNTLIVDPITASHNELGYSTSDVDDSTKYFNERIEIRNTALPNQLNSLLLHRNGPYGHPMWKQWRGYNHPVARNHRLNNTMSIDATTPLSDTRYRSGYIPTLRRLHGENFDLNTGFIFDSTMQGSLVGQSPNDKPGHQVYHTVVSTPTFDANNGYPDLKHFYEPAVVSRYKPFLYEYNNAYIVKQTLLNEISYFSNPKLDRTAYLHTSPNSSSTHLYKSKTFYFQTVKAAKNIGATDFLYSETIFPTEINAYRTYKLTRTSYEESSGYDHGNGYDFVINRTFWRNILGGGQFATSDGTTRLRTPNDAINSLGVKQTADFLDRFDTDSLRSEIFAASGSLNYYVPPKAHRRGLFGHNNNYATASLRITGALGLVTDPNGATTKCDMYIIVTGGLATNNFGAPGDHSGSYVARRYMALTKSFGAGVPELGTCRFGCNSDFLHKNGYAVASDVVGFNANGTPLTTAQSLSQSISNFQYGRLSCSIDVVNPDNDVTITFHQLWGGSEFNGLGIYASHLGISGSIWQGTDPVPSAPGTTPTLSFEGGMGATYDSFNRGAVSGGAWADGDQGVNLNRGTISLNKNTAIGLPLIKFDRKYSSSFIKPETATATQNTADKDILRDGHHIYYINNGIVSNPIINTTASSLDADGMPQRNQGIVVGTTDYHGLGHPFCQLNAYQPFSFAALSSWPLDVRDDIFGTVSSFNALETNARFLIEEQAANAAAQMPSFHSYKILTHAKTPYLTSSIGGKGIMIGLSPHTLTASTEQLLDLQFGGGAAPEYHRLDYGPHSTNLMANHIRSGHTTRSVGELVYSTKPSIFFYRRHGQELNAAGTIFGLNTEGGLGYLHPTASLQYNRHAYPYQTPFYATNRIVNRAPFFDSYADFIGNDLKYLGREYSIIPEFRMSEHMQDYAVFMHLFRGQTIGAGHAIGLPVHDKKSITNFGKVYNGEIEADNSYIDVADGSANLLGPVMHVPIKSRSNFLSLLGADVTASAYTKDSHYYDNAGENQNENTTIYDWDPLSGSVSGPRYEETDAYGKYNYTYKVDPLSVEFYAKYSQTEKLNKLKTLLDAVPSFGHVPKQINFDVKGIKKLLVYSGFYPVTRTTQIGWHLAKAFGGDLDNHDFANARLGHRDGDGHMQPEPQSAMGTIDRFKDYGIFNSLGNKIAVPYGQLDPNDLSAVQLSAWRILQVINQARLQSFVEPLMAPGILYNSIKSGMAVDYPIYTVPPKFFAPLAFTGSWVTQSFDYGGGYMMGASRAFPTILTSQPNVRMPFEALYDFSMLQATYKSAEGYNDSAAATTLSTTEFDSFRSNYLVPDFVDYDSVPTSSMYYRGGPGDGGRASVPIIEGQGRMENLHGLTASYVYTPNAGIRDNINYSINKDFYYSAINNFLAETMNFYLMDIDPKVQGIKFPIVVSETKASRVKLDAADTAIPALMQREYSMGVTLTMGTEQIMCEGPRNSGFAKRTVPYDKWVTAADTTQSVAPTRYQQTSSIRGYIYGPPTEIIHHEFGETNFVEVLDKKVAGFTAATEQNRIRWDDYASYFAANLQDPAYQAYTPPYFYGDSTLILRFNNSGFDTFGAVDAAAVLQEATITSIRDRAVSDGVTGSYNFEKYNLASLCTSFPTTSSISVGTTTRMKVKNCMEAFGSFPARAKIGFIDPTATPVHEDYDFWFMQLKWVAPVLNFFHTSSYYRPTISDPNFNLESEKWTTGPGPKTQWTASNPYHDETTGRGLWGGYGSCPYDGNLEECLYPEGFKLEKGLIDDGIYLKIHEVPFLSSLKDLESSGQYKDQVIGFGSTGLSSNSGYYSALDQFLGDVTATGEVAGDKQFLVGGSLIEDLDLFKAREFEIGRVADRKTISEAVVVIPYFDQPVVIRPINLSLTGPAKEDPFGALENEIYKTREIIPGKYFLPIHKRTFQHILSTVLVNTYDFLPQIRKQYLGGEEFTSTTYGVKTASGQGPDLNDPDSKELSPSANLAQVVDHTDCGKMISLLLGASPFFAKQLGDGWQTGYQLPPEFDFINNYAVDPFQMMVIPFSHELQKRDLINMYQGIMPDMSLRAEHVNSVFSANPGRETIINDRVFPDYLLGTRTTTGASEPKIYNLSSFDNGNFLRPYHLSTQGENNILIDSIASQIPGWTEKEFYENLRFMVFKVKQRSIKSFHKYKKRQLVTMIKKQLGEIEHVQELELNNSLLETLQRDEIYGMNWPYDFFSLIEAIKLDVNIKL